jgi:ABC-type multidrug transport system fused ATPase/permease subunit
VSRAPASRRVLLRSFAFLRPYWKLTAGGYIALFSATGLSLATPQFVRWIIDKGIRHADPTLLAWSVGLLLAVTAARGVFTYLEGIWSEIASQGVAYDLRNAIHAKIASLSFAYHDQAETGDLLARSVQDVDRVRFLTGRAFLRLVEGGFLLVGTAVFLIAMNPLLAVLTLSTTPLLVWRGVRFGARYRPLSLEIQRSLSRLTNLVEQNLRGARVVKAFAREEEEIRRFGRENSRWLEQSAVAARMQAWNTPLLDMLGNIGTVVIIWLGGLLVIRSRLSLGELVAFSTYVAQLVRPIRRLGMVIPAVSMASSSAERIFEILDARSEVRDAPDAVALQAVRGEVRFERVGLSYFGRERVLSDVTFDARPGEVIALVGTTGSGKTSIVNLIPRFYDATEGRVLIDGIDVRTVTLASLRTHIGIVLQDTTLFATTIRENIRFGRPDAGDREVIEAAEAAQARPFIEGMPEGYDTAVGEKGDTLSGGQKQRVAIARALLQDPRILILDDATASVDTETEQLIRAALDRLMAGRTTFVVAHRLGTIRRADRILVLDRGRLVGTGTHAQLLASCGVYVDIYHRQLRSADGPGRDHAEVPA